MLKLAVLLASSEACAHLLHFSQALTAALHVMVSIWMLLLAILLESSRACVHPPAFSQALMAAFACDGAHMDAAACHSAHEPHCPFASIDGSIACDGVHRCPTGCCCLPCLERGSCICHACISCKFQIFASMSPLQCTTTQPAIHGWPRDKHYRGRSIPKLRLDVQHMGEPLDTHYDNTAIMKCQQAAVMRESWSPRIAMQPQHTAVARTEDPNTMPT